MRTPRLVASLLLVAVTTVIQAQDRPAGAPPPADIKAPVAPRIVLTAGRSMVLDTEFGVVRIAVTNPAVADAVVVQPREILLDGKTAGTISLIVWGEGGRRVVYDIAVEPAVTTLEQRLKALYPGDDINVSVTDEALILSGNVASTSVMLKAGEIAEASHPKLKVINLLQLPGEYNSQQVMLQVRIAEVNRRALTEAGLSVFSSPGGKWVGRVTTQQFPAPDFEEDKLVFSDFLNLFVLNWEHDIGALVRALKQKGFFQSLAEPNLIAYNGQEASFLAGGEFPVPVVSGLTGMITIQWKEFGVRLKFKPTIAGDVIRLKVEPEVSSLDFNNGVTLQGWRIPSLITRRASTDVELRDGQSFAIAGLLNNQSQANNSSIPWLGDIPIIGNLFKGKSDKAEQTELMVLVTPRLVRALNPDEVPPLPTMPAAFIGAPPPAKKAPEVK